MTAGRRPTVAAAVCAVPTVETSTPVCAANSALTGCGLLQRPWQLWAGPELAARTSREKRRNRTVTARMKISERTSTQYYQDVSSRNRDLSPMFGAWNRKKDVAKICSMELMFRLGPACQRKVSISLPTIPKYDSLWMAVKMEIWFCIYILLFYNLLKRLKDRN
jgi:hypothetical protein